MNSRTAPRAATWLLERVGGRSRFEPLIGDLLEQFEAGRSRLWYWRQALGTVALDAARTTRAHALSYLAAIAAGCSLIGLLDGGYAYVIHPLQDSLSAVSQEPWSVWSALRILGMALCGTLATMLIFITAWAVTRIHRAHPRAVLAVCAAAVTLRYLPGLAKLASHAATDTRFTAALVLHHLHLMVPVLWQALCILAAGLWVVRRPRIDGRGHLPYCLAVVAVSLNLLSALASAAAMAGAVIYTVNEQYATDVLKIGSAACVVFLLWRPDSTILRFSGGDSRAHSRDALRIEAGK